MDTATDTDRLKIRVLGPADLDRLVKIDQVHTGRNRRLWFEGKIRRATADSDLWISLGAEADGRLVGALLGSLQYGEFGQPEPIATLDTILVEPESGRQGVARALVEQLVRNLEALGIERIRTEVGWRELELLGFLGHQGFSPSPQLVLELDVRRALAAQREREVTESLSPLEACTRG